LNTKINIGGEGEIGTSIAQIGKFPFRELVLDVLKIYLPLKR